MLSPDSSKIEAILSNQYQQQQQQQKNANICLEFVANCLQLFEIEIIENLFWQIGKNLSFLSLHRGAPFASFHSSFDEKTPVARMVSLQTTPLYGL